jgi:hypothetical protein
LAKLKDTGTRRIEYYDGDEWKPAKMGRGGKPYCYGFLRELREVIDATGADIQTRVAAKWKSNALDVQWIPVEDEDGDSKNRK